MGTTHRGGSSGPKANRGVVRETLITGQVGEPVGTGKQPLFGRSVKRSTMQRFWDGPPMRTLPKVYKVEEFSKGARQLNGKQQTSHHEIDTLTSRMERSS